MNDWIDSEATEVIENVLELYIEEQKLKIVELSEEVLLLKTRMKYLEKQLNESPVPMKMKKRVLDLKLDNFKKENEIHELKVEIFELRKLIPEGILINRQKKEKPVREGRQLR